MKVLDHEKQHKWMIDKYNEADKNNSNFDQKKLLVSKVSELKFVRFEGVLISSATHGYRGVDLFAKTTNGSYVPPPNINNFVDLKWFNGIKKLKDTSKPLTFIGPPMLPQVPPMMSQ